MFKGISCYFDEEFDHEDETNSQSSKAEVGIPTQLFPSTLLSFQTPPPSSPPHDLIVEYSVIGLPNLGNTCYLNSVVQSLVSLKSLKTYFERDVMGLGCGQLTLALQELVRSITIAPTSAKNVHLKTLAFVICIKENLKDFVQGFQMDAHEFLITLLNQLDAALVHEHFVGLINCISCCSNINCKFESVKQEPITALTLRFSSPSPCDLKSCLQMFNEKESLDINSTCSHCGLNTVSERNLCVTSWSNVLVIHLSRFCRLQEVKKNTKIDHTHIRLDTPISFPLIGLEVGSELYPIVYDCVAVCNHVGTCTRGHYTTHALRGEKWFFLNDAKKPVEINSLHPNIGERNSDAYMLFYERRR